MIGGERSGIKVRETEAFIARVPGAEPGDELYARKLCASEGHAISSALGWCEEAAKARNALTAYVDAPDGTEIYRLQSDGSGTVTITGATS